MRKQEKFIITRSLLTMGAVFALAYIPEGHAFGGYGRTVDEWCQGLVAQSANEGRPATPATPYADNGCGLCHVADRSVPVEPQWSAFHLIGPLAFCDQEPDSVITAPVNNSTVALGAEVRFAGHGSNAAPDPVVDEPLTYAWDFGGAAGNSSEQNPTVRLSKAGPIMVTFTAIDSIGEGRPDPEPAKIVINVVDPDANQPPNGEIVSPRRDKSVKAGRPILFSGSASDPENDKPFMYKWDFGDGSATDFMAESKLYHTYEFAGIYTATLTVKDNGGLADPTPAALTVTVKSKDECTDRDKDNFSPDGGVCGPIDCNDHDASINPGALEACGDKVDNDCNGQIDNNDKQCREPSCLGDLLKQIEITKAYWDREDRELTVKGTWPTPGVVVTLSDKLTGEVLGSTKTRAHDEDEGDHHKKPQESVVFWEFELEHIPVVPCRVRVEIDGRIGERDVAYAPVECSGKPPVTNTTPVANDDSASTKGGAAVTIPVLANDTDQDKDSLTIVVFTQPRHGVVTRNGEALTYTPAKKGKGKDRFSYTVSDRHGGTDKATVNIELEK